MSTKRPRLTRDGPRPLLVDVIEASALLGVSRRTLYRLTEAGRLPFKKVGDRRLFRTRDLEAFAADEEAVLTR